jgi:hypothetical protein
MAALLGLVLLLGGCRRDEKAQDDRTLDQKPHTETDTFQKQDDPFRP